MLRIGIGYDVHPLVEGRRLVIAGVEIPFERGLAGHSDADVAAHAIVDALLGAAALGDIGAHFPPGDPSHRDASSLGFLEAVAELLAERQWRVGNIDATIIAQKPRLAPFVLQMRQNVSQALGVDLDRVSIKATTTDRLGFEGQGQGIAAHAVALIENDSP